ncbi:site-specific DNA-methyltransferase [Galactobacter valiniphilus]|uniref:Site-specific DNA-methyltransferase n=1 Tax=Galactobacter valiniphilus TaxID=2676122 RepID=A0A399J752_9MICC|nr:DNA methyltransferase [Galactobacter valiniphilus]RII41335.1 site-specific DNA-methyltransferase [Galactobacter valiniphilus]
MSRLSELLRTLEQLDPKLAKDLDDEIRPLQKRLPFGLNFERHAPEAVELAGHRIRKGNKVRVLPPRGSTDRGDQRLWHVDSLSGGIAEVSTPNSEGRTTQSVPVEDLILVAEFRDHIYPGLRPGGSVERGADKPFHTVINGENFHVLELLTFTHEHSVDAIYIDPPYNTGSRDWKYNNDYVEGDDLYRHSKWLAFMERRLKLAKRLLKPDNSVLIVTIDEKEYLRLGLLLGQVFDNARIQMASIVINGQGSARQMQMSRVDEYAYFVYLGEAKPTAVAVETLQSDDSQSQVGAERIWFPLIRGGKSGVRAKSNDSFFPIYVDDDTGRIRDVGYPLPPLEHPDDSVPPPDGCVSIWPISRGGIEGRWQMSRAEFISRLEKGYIRVGGKGKNGRWPITYVRAGTIARIESGEVVVQGRDDRGALILANDPDNPRGRTPKTVWYRKSHNAGTYGTDLLNSLTPGRDFPFPKSLYAVEDALRFFVSDKPNAVVLDFFSGSGTTAHAVMRLNKQDGGSRQCISVTNNEVSAEEHAKLRRQGLRPGDPEWEQWGICDYITKPRIRAAITGLTPEGEPIKGEYKFIDEFPMSDGFEENAAFFTLSYESPWMIEADKAFAAIAPMLWLRAGAVGERIDSLEGGWAVADSYGVLKDLDLASDFIAELQRRQGIRIAYVVTDDDGRYQQVASEIPGIETVRLYEDYLRNCESTGDI